MNESVIGDVGVNGTGELNETAELNESEFVEADEKVKGKKNKTEDKKNKIVGKDKGVLITGNVVDAVDLWNESLNESLNESVEDYYVRVLINFSVHDLDGDGFVDYVEWLVPHLSNQTYEISLEILNVQSYPTVGGNWTVGFNTTGEANLTISAFNGTTYGFGETGDDLVFLETKCGDEVLNVSVVVNESVLPYDVYLKKKRIEEIRRLLE